MLINFNQALNSNDHEISNCLRSLAIHMIKNLHVHLHEFIKQELDAAHSALEIEGYPVLDIDNPAYSGDPEQIFTGRYEMCHSSALVSRWGDLYDYRGSLDNYTPEVEQQQMVLLHLINQFADCSETAMVLRVRVVGILAQIETNKRQSR